MRRARRGRRREAPGNEVPEAGLSCGLACGVGSKCRAGILDRGVRNWIAECPEMLENGHLYCEMGKREQVHVSLMYIKIHSLAARPPGSPHPDSLECPAAAPSSVPVLFAAPLMRAEHGRASIHRGVVGREAISPATCPCCSVDTGLDSCSAALAVARPGGSRRSTRGVPVG